MNLPIEYYAFSGAVNCITSLILGIVVFYKSSHVKANRIYAYFCFSISFWSLFYYIWLSTGQKPLAEFFLRTCMIGVILMPSLFVHFTICFLKRRESFKFIAFNYIASCLFMLTVYTPLYATNSSSFLVFPYWLKPGIIFHFFLTHFVVIFCYSFYLLWKDLLTAEGIFKNQLRYVFLGILIGLFSGTTNFFSWYRIPIPPFLNILVALYMLIIAYGIAKYHVMDIRLAITKVGIFFLVYALVLSIPLWLGYKHQLWEESVWLMLFLATTGPYIYTFLRKQVENSLLQEQKSYQKTLKQASYGIGKIKKLETLVKLIDRTLMRSVGIERCTIYLIDKEEEDPVFNLTKPNNSIPPTITISPEVLNALKRFSEPFIIEELVYHNPDNSDVKQIVEFLHTFPSEIVIPIVQSDKLLSLILLGKKKDNTVYTNDDLTVFTILASQAGLAIENCLFIEAEKERMLRESTSNRRESLDMLVSTMAHEIDNPIQGAIGQAEMLKICLDFFRHHIPKETMDEAKQYCEKIEANCMRVSKIVKAVENYSKRETGNLKLVTLEDVITPFHSLVPMIQKKYKDVNYTEDIEESLPSVWAEEIMIEEILMNLIENAYHAVIHNEGKKSVHLHISKKNNDYIQITVRDNGYGIASKIKKQLFQVPTTTKGSSEGTGLGLYRIRQICEILKAKYGVESQGRGKGALFYVEFPIHNKISKTKEPTDG